jgi:hypothetical protein
MKVYIASNFADKDRVKARGEELAALGIECTSRWASETAPHDCKITDKPAQYMRETAVFDIEDILAADKVVLTVPTHEQLVNMTPHQMSRGGRTFESGMMYGMILAQWLVVNKATYEAYSKSVRGCIQELIVMGEKENVFHFLDGTETAAAYPVVVVIPTWEEVKQYLTGQLGQTQDN